MVDYPTPMNKPPQVWIELSDSDLSEFSACFVTSFGVQIPVVRV
jgi:hypothetical protein